MGADKANCLFDIKLCAATENEGTIYPSPSHNKYEGALKAKWHIKSKLPIKIRQAGTINIK